MILIFAMMGWGCTSNTLEPVRASTASGQGDFCQLLTDQQSRTCPELEYLSSVEVFCVIADDEGEAEALKIARGQLIPEAIRAVEVAFRMECRGIGGRSTSSSRTTATTRLRARATRTTTTTTTTVPKRISYVDQLLLVEAAARELVDHLEEVNKEWEERTRTLAATDVAFEEALEVGEGVWNDFEQIRPLSQPGISVVHTTMKSAVVRINAQAHAMLAGLRSPDAGQARTRALTALLAAFDVLEAEINRTAALLGYTEPPPRTTTTTRAPTTTTRAPTTTTTTKPPTTTTMSDAQAEAVCRADPDCILAAFAVVIAEPVATLGATLDQAIELAEGTCDLLDAGIPWGLVLAEILIDPALTEEESMAGAGIMGAGVQAFCPRHWWQVEDFNNSN